MALDISKFDDADGSTVFDVKGEEVEVYWQGLDDIEKLEAVRSNRAFRQAQQEHQREHADELERIEKLRDELDKHDEDEEGYDEIQEELAELTSRAELDIGDEHVEPMVDTVAAKVCGADTLEDGDGEPIEWSDLSERLQRKILRSDFDALLTCWTQLLEDGELDKAEGNG